MGPILIMRNIRAYIDSVIIIIAVITRYGEKHKVNVWHTDYIKVCYNVVTVISNPVWDSHLQIPRSRMCGSSREPLIALIH